MSHITSNENSSVEASPTPLRHPQVVANQVTRPLNVSTDYSSYGITGVVKSSANTAAWGRTKTFVGLYMKEWAFLGISTINLIAAIILTIVRLVNVEEHDHTSPDFTLTILILLNSVFCGFYVYHGVLKEREFEIYAFIAAAIVILVYCLAEYCGNVHGRTTIKLVRLIAACGLAPPNIFLAWSVARDFGYLEFRVVGASQVLQGMYKRAALFSSLLQFDLQIALSFIILVLKDGVMIYPAEQWSLGIGIPFSLIWTILGMVMLFREIRHLVGAFVVLGFAKPSYIIYRIVRTSLDFPQLSRSHRIIVYVMFTAGALSLLLFAVLMFELVFVVRNFGHGLRDTVYQSDNSETAGLLAGHRSPRRSMRSDRSSSRSNHSEIVHE